MVLGIKTRSESFKGFKRLMGTMKRILAFGNPLLDTTVYIEDSSLLEKYNLQEDGHKEITEQEMKSLSSDIQKYKLYYSAGGCAQNSLRVIQWLMKTQWYAVIFGSVGKDEEAKILRKLLQGDGVTTRYIEQDKPTGKTVALIKGTSRSLTAYLGAAELLPLSNLLSIDDFEELVLHSDYVYIEGFFLTNRTGTAKCILDFCNDHKKIIIFNLSAEYVCNMYPDIVKYFATNSDIIFGNKREFEALSKIMNLKSIEDVTDEIIKNSRNKLEHGNIVIITDGSNPGICVYGKGEVINYVVPSIDENDIRDTTGAGDAFTGGFIAGLGTNRTVNDCVKLGCYAALQIIKQVGCMIPDFEPELTAE